MNSEGVTCSAIEQHLALYVGGDLDGATLRSVESHLTGCRACSERAHRARSAREVLVAGLRAHERRGIDLWPGVRAALEREGLAASRPGPGVPGPHVNEIALRRKAPAWRLRRVASLAAAAVLLGFFAQQVWWSSDEAPRSGETRPTIHPVIAEPVRPDPIQVVPVAAATGGLRRLAPDEARLIDSADLYDPQASGFTFRSMGNANVGSPASLQTNERPQGLRRVH